MATNLNPGFSNDINIIQIRVDGAHMHRVTDRPIDIDGDGDKEQVTIVHDSGSAVGTPSAPGGKVRSHAVIPAGSARTIVDEVTEKDGGINLDRDVSQFTEGT